MSFWKDRKTLVTGGASFIGSHLVEMLVSEGARVRVADDLSSGRKENLSAVMDRIEFLEGNLRNRDFAGASCRGIDTVLHLAASHGGRGYIDTHPVECAQNMLLDCMVFEAAHASNVGRICFASSACVYPTGLQDKPRTGNLVYLEEEWADHFQPGKANSDGEYGWAKFMGEMTLKAYHKQYGLKCSSCRIFTAYGERENETHAVIALIAKAFVGMDPYVIWGSGEQDRNFSYVGDIVQGLMLAAEKITDGRAVNVGTSQHVTINEVCEKIFDITSFRPKKIERDLSKPVGVFSRAASTKNTKKWLGWEPSTSIEEGLKRTIKWYFSSKNKDEIRKKLDVLLTER